MGWTRTRYGDPIAAAQAGVKNASLQLGYKIAVEAKNICKVKTGQLRNSICVSSKETELGLNDDSSGEKARTLNAQGLKDDQCFVGTASDHAVFVEFGTKKQVAQPYLRPAKDKVINGATDQEIIARYGRAAMEEEFKRRV